MIINWKATFLTLIIISATLIAAKSTFAENPNQSPEMQQLIKRLESAESQIGQLQQQLHQAESSSAGNAGVSKIGILRMADSDSDKKKDAHDEKKKKDEEEKKKEKERAKKIKDLESDVDEILGHMNKGTNWVYSGHSGSTMKITGRLHADYWSFPQASSRMAAQEGLGVAPGTPIDPQDRFGFRRIRFGFQGDIKDNMFYKIELDFGTASNPVFKDNYLGFKNLPFLQKVTIGQQKRPYGLDHLNSSRYNTFMERPFIVEALNSDARRLGITSQGVSEDLAWNWRYGVFNQRDISGGNLGQAIDDHYQLEVAGRLANTIWYDDSSGGRGYAHWAISGTVADSKAGSNGVQVNDTRFRTRPEARSRSRWLNTGRIAGANSFEILGTEAVINVGSVQLVGEYMNLWVQRDAAIGHDLHFHGAYGYASWFLTGEHVPWNRKSGTIGRVKPFQNFFLVNTCDGETEGGWGAWQVAARYSYADFTDSNILGGVGESVTLGVNWYWNPYARMQFNYINGRINQLTPIAGQTGGTYQILGMRMMVDF